MEIVLEFIMELYLELAALFCPRGLKKRQQNLLRFLSIIICSAIAVLLIMGATSLFENGPTAVGIILTSVGGGLLLLQILAFVLLKILKRKKPPRDRTS